MALWFVVLATDKLAYLLDVASVVADFGRPLTGFLLRSRSIFFMML